MTGREIVAGPSITLVSTADKQAGKTEREVEEGTKQSEERQETTSSPALPSKARTIALVVTLTGV